MGASSKGLWLSALATGVAALCLSVPAVAQTWTDTGSSRSQSVGLDLGAAFDGPAVGPVDWARETWPRRLDQGVSAVTRNDLWREGPNGAEHFRLTAVGALRRADGSPLPPTPLEPAMLDEQGHQIDYRRNFISARGRTAGGLEVSLTPHIGLGAGSDGGSAEAGATLRIGNDLERLVPDGADAFGDRGRWYLYAAGSGRAVGYNFARTRDGDFERSGMSQDEGAFLGDASVGVAWRRGDVQSSFGVVYREIEAEGLRGGHGLDNDVTEGLVAFQLSIKPD